MKACFNIPAFLPVHPLQPSVSNAITHAVGRPNDLQVWTDLGDTFLRGGYPRNALLALEYAESLGPPLQSHELQRLRDGAVLTFNVNQSDLDQINYWLRQYGGVVQVERLRAMTERRYGDSQFFSFDPPDTIEKSPIIKGGYVYLFGAEQSEPDPLCEATLDILFGDAGRIVDKHRQEVLDRESEMSNWMDLHNALVAVKLGAEADTIISHVARTFPRSWEKYINRLDSLKRVQAAVQCDGDCRLPRSTQIKDMLASYFRRNRIMSDPFQKMNWAGDIDFPCNEPELLRPFMPGADNIMGSGGIYVGTGAGLHLFHMPYQNARHGFVVDYNRSVSELLLPAIGSLLIASDSPAMWLSYLMAIPLDEGMGRKLAGVSGRDLMSKFSKLSPDLTYFEKICADLGSLLLPFFPKRDRQMMVERLFRVMDSLQNDLNLEYLAESTSEGYGGPISSLENFTAARKLWLEHRVTGISADWQGSVHHEIAMVAAHMDENVRVIYPSNIQAHAVRRSSNLQASIAFAGGLSAVPTDDDTRVIFSTAGGLNTMIYPLQDLLRFMGKRPGSEREAMVRYAILSAIGYAKDDPVKIISANWKFTNHHKLEKVEKHPLVKALHRALTLFGERDKQPLNNRDLREIVSEHNLGRTDAWRLRFALRYFGVI